MHTSILKFSVVIGVMGHSMQRDMNLPLENYPSPLIGQAPHSPLKMKIFWPPPHTASPH